MANRAPKESGNGGRGQRMAAASLLQTAVSAKAAAPLWEDAIGASCLGRPLSSLTQTPELVPCMYCVGFIKNNGKYCGWRPGEPNDSNGEDCVEVGSDGWNDVVRAC